MTHFNEWMQVVLEQVVRRNVAGFIEEGEELILEMGSESVVVTRKRNIVTARLLDSFRDEFSFEV